MPTNNFTKWLLESNQCRLEKTAVITSDIELTFGKLTHAVKAFAGFLLNQNLQPQQRIIIQLDDCAEWPVCFLAAIAVGLNPITVSVDVHPTTLNTIIDTSNASAIISKNFNADHSNILHITKDQVFCNHTHLLENFYNYQSTESCVWLISSGTTGEPKCVVHKHDTLLWLSTALPDSVFGIDHASNILSTAKLSFCYGMAVNIIFGLSKGATIHLISGVPGPSKIFDCIDHHNITHVFAVPAVINAMLKHPSDSAALDSVTVMVSAGESLPAGLAQQFRDKYHVPVLDGLGMSETIFIYCGQSLNNIEVGTIGQPILDVVIELRNQDGSITVDGDIGEMYVRHPGAAMQYWNDSDKTDKTFIQGWVKTNDLAVKTQSGNYKYVSRNDDLIKINGLYVSPLEIEIAMMSNPAVVDCTVVASSNPAGLHEVHAFVITVDSVIHLRNHLTTLLPHYKIPKHFHIVDSLPKTITNKKQRSQLRDLL